MFYFVYFSMEVVVFPSQTTSPLNVNCVSDTTSNALKIWYTNYTPSDVYSSSATTSCGPSNWTPQLVDGVRRTIISLKVVTSVTEKTESTNWFTEWFKHLRIKSSYFIRNLFFVSIRPIKEKYKNMKNILLCIGMKKWLDVYCWVSFCPCYKFSPLF